MIPNVHNMLCSVNQKDLTGLFGKQAAMSLAARPRYPGKWFSRLAALTPRRYLAWDIGTGNVQATNGVAEHYKQVTQVKNSKSMLCHMPKFSIFTPHYQMSDDQLADIIGGGNSVDLVTVAAALRWYSIDCEKKLPFPFEGAGVGSKRQIVDLLSEEVVKELEGAWDGSYLAAIYSESRPRYPSEWFSMLAALTPQHSVAWDVGTGNGQAAIGVAEQYKKVIATDISDEQLKHAIPHPQVQYVHTPLAMSDDELVSLIGGEDSVDLITAATAVQWFDLDRFYPIVKRVLRKPGGIIAVWCYGSMEFSPEIDGILGKFFELGIPFQSQSFKIALQCYKTLPFPFESVGVGCEGQPLELDMRKEMSFQGLLKFLRSLPVVHIAKEQGVDLLPEELLKEFERAWGEPEMVRTAIYKTYMLAGKVKL
ncbi:hypothetical protein POTOM_027440 [Populus tomentosa]|uniref:Methyltransferase type 11 domain-containing protein n=1 Tax=Populus tomentosa TaxID=118781 RepID=A0A8X8CVX2_POPTO|nr:hypothetical protein POTOM_027440 [Populus tomentosa]